MSITQKQSLVINKLLDKYEKSKTFLGSNKVNQSFIVNITDLFKKYDDDAEYELFCSVNESLNNLQKLNLITIEYKPNGAVKQVTLNLDKLEAAYLYVQREPKKDKNEWLINILQEFAGHPVMDKYIATQLQNISNNKKIEGYSEDKQEYVDALTLIRALLVNEDECFVRDFSVRLFKDSKRVEKLQSTVQSILFKYGEFHEQKTVMEECGVVQTPTYVNMKGNATICFGGQQLDLSKISGDIALSSVSLQCVSDMVINSNKIITIENLTTFHTFPADDFVIYLGGFHNSIKRKFLIDIYLKHPDKEYLHFGDIDAGGFYILNHLREKTGIPFKSLMMDVETLQKYEVYAKKLTENDKIRIKKLKSEVNDEAELALFNYMLQHNCKLEQEAVHKE